MANLVCRLLFMIEKPLENTSIFLRKRVTLSSWGRLLKTKWYCKEIKTFFYGTIASRESWSPIGFSAVKTWQVLPTVLSAQFSSTFTNGPLLSSSFSNHFQHVMTSKLVVGSHQLRNSNSAHTSINSTKQPFWTIRLSVRFRPSSNLKSCIQRNSSVQFSWFSEWFPLDC